MEVQVLKGSMVKCLATDEIAISKSACNRDCFKWSLQECHPSATPYNILFTCPTCYPYEARIGASHT